MDGPKLVRESIAEQVYTILKREILLARRKPGEQINPREIAQKLGLSTMPIRDALKHLVDEGLVVRKPRVGFFVRSFTDEEIREIMEMRKLYELYCLDKYFDQIDRQKLQECLRRCQEFNSLSEKNNDSFEEIDDCIHNIIVRASGNAFLMKGYNNIKDFIILIRRLVRSSTPKANEEHIALIESILEGNKERAKHILESHLDRVTSLLCS